MHVNFTEVQNIFIVCGHTDMRCGIDGLASLVSDKYNLDLFSDAIFLFCGRKKDRYKALYWDRDGFMLLYNFHLFRTDKIIVIDIETIIINRKYVSG